MPIGQLQYDLETEGLDFLRAIRSLDLALSLWDIDQHLRLRIKYGELPGEVANELQEVRNQLHDIMHRHGVDLDELIE